MIILMIGKRLSFCLFVYGAICFVANACAAMDQMSAEHHADFSDKLQVSAKQDSYLRVTTVDSSTASTQTEPFRNRPIGQEKAGNGPRREQRARADGQWNRL